MPLTRARVEELQADAFAEDVPIIDEMLSWTEEQCEAYFTSGGDERPPSVDPDPALKMAEMRLAPISAEPNGSMPHVTLNDGRCMPLLGLGLWKTQNKGETHAAVKAAIKAGYRHLDTAYVYMNEAEVGSAVAESISEGLVSREELWVTSKLWVTQMANVKAACRGSLSRLKMDYLDLYLVHVRAIATSRPAPQPSPSAPLITASTPLSQMPAPAASGEPSLASIWSAMEALAEEGLAKSVGVSNFSAKKLQALAEGARRVPAINQCECHPVWRQEALIRACDSLGVHLTAYSPLGSPDSAGMRRVPAAEANAVMAHPTIVKVAAEAGRSPAQVLIRWALQRGTSVLPKSANASRIGENIDVLSWQLSDEQMAMVSSIEPQRRLLTMEWALPKDGPYKSVAELWDE